jgi:hypothetical protein
MSSSALVAIIGGLLVSRLVALSAERSGLERRRRELELKHAGLEEGELALIRQERRATCRLWFEEHHRERVVAERGETDPEELLDWLPRGTRPEEELAMAEDLVRRVKNAFEAIELRYSTEPPLGDIEDLARAGVQVPAGDDDLWQAVVAFLESARRPRSPFDTPVFVRPLRDLSPLVARHDQHISRERELEAARDATSAEIGLMDDELRRVGTPAHVGLAFCVLGLFALAGAAFPIGVLSLDSTDNSSQMRVAVLIAFLLGLAALFSYLIVARQDLHPPTTVPGGARSLHGPDWLSRRRHDGAPRQVTTRPPREARLLTGPAPLGGKEGS